MVSRFSDASMLSTTSAPVAQRSPRRMPALVETTMPSRHLGHGLAHDLLGAVGLGRIDEVDAEIERLAQKRHRLIDGEAPTLSDPAVAAGAEAGDAHLQARTSQGRVLHWAILRQIGRAHV